VSDEAARGNDARLSIMHSAAPAEAAVLASELGALLQTSEAPISNLAPAIVTHVGPGALAVGFFAKA
jgi:fatty acid-binding protein DegV